MNRNAIAIIKDICTLASLHHTKGDNFIVWLLFFFHFIPPFLFGANEEWEDIVGGSLMETYSKKSSLYAEGVLINDTQIAQRYEMSKIKTLKEARTINSSLFYYWPWTVDYRLTTTNFSLFTMDYRPLSVVYCSWSLICGGRNGREFTWDLK